MANIELVIKISEEDFETMKHNVAVDNPLCPLDEKEMVTKVANGTPLPKGHGRIYDIDMLKKHYSALDSLDEQTNGEYIIAPIIEADKE